MKYKIGDKVRVRKDLVPGNFYGKDYYISDMDKFKGEKCFITGMWDQSYQINNFGYWWSEEMFESVDDEKVLEYALEKLGMTKEELENEMNGDKEDLAFIEKCIKNKNKIREHCKKFNSSCDGCEVKKFKDKYKNKYKNRSDIPCDDVFRYLKEKGEI